MSSEGVVSPANAWRRRDRLAVQRLFLVGAALSIALGSPAAFAQACDELGGGPINAASVCAGFENFCGSSFTSPCYDQITTLSESQRIVLRSTAEGSLEGCTVFRRNADGSRGPVATNTMITLVSQDGATCFPAVGGQGSFTTNGLPNGFQQGADLSLVVEATGNDLLCSDGFIVECDFESAGDTSPQTQILLNRGRFRVSLDWQRPPNAVGLRPALVSRLRTEDSGLFYFTNPANLELLIKVLNGCGFNGHYWVFFAATTDVEFELRVTDTLRGLTKTYRNPNQRPADAVTDTSALPTCP